MSRRLRAAYAATIEPLRLGVSLGLDYGLAVYPDDGEQQEILIRVADERLYQLKNAAQPPAAAGAGPAETRPAPTPGNQVTSPTRTITQASQSPEATWPAFDQWRYH